MNCRDNHNSLRIALVLSVAWLLAGPSPSALAAKGGNNTGNGGGGNGVNRDPVCISFEGGGVQSDGGLYCDSEEENIEAVITRGGYLSLDPGESRGLVVDFGRPLHLLGPEALGLSIDFQSTAELEIEDRVTVQSYVLLFRLSDGTDLRDMAVGETRTDGSMRITMVMAYDGGLEEGGTKGRLYLNYDPYYSRKPCSGYGSTWIDITRDTEFKWTISVDETSDKASLLEVYKTGKTPTSSVEYCHTDPDGLNEPLFHLPSFKMTVEELP